MKIYDDWRLLERQLLDRLAPLADLAARLYVANVFFASGWNKIQDWDSTLYLFRGCRITSNGGTCSPC